MRNASADPNKYDMGSGGAATITGSVGGSVIANTSLLSDLIVTINFGEVSPANTNRLVKVVVPIAIRSTAAYQLTVTLSPGGPLSADPNDVQYTDIGFGIQNLRRSGANATNCGGNSTVTNPFLNDPSLSMTTNSAGRATYPSTLDSIGSSIILMNGPVLSLFSNVANFKRSTDNAWIFDAIFTIAPQYYTPGAFSSITLSFRISANTVCTCPCV